MVQKSIDVCDLKPLRAFLWMWPLSEKNKFQILRKPHLMWILLLVICDRWRFIYPIQVTSPLIVLWLSKSLCTFNFSYDSFCMCVCMYVCMYVWMDGWMDGWMDACMHCMDVCMYICMHVCMHECSFEVAFCNIEIGR